MYRQLVDDTGADTDDLASVLRTLKELIEADRSGLLENDPELRKEIWQVVNFKLGMDDKNLKEASEDFEFRAGNYERLYEAIQEQMKVIDQIKNKKQ